MPEFFDLHLFDWELVVDSAGVVLVVPVVVVPVVLGDDVPVVLGHFFAFAALCADASWAGGADGVTGTE